MVLKKFADPGIPVIFLSQVFYVKDSLIDTLRNIHVVSFAKVQFLSILP